MADISRVTTQRANTGTVRHETHEGRDHLVVPVVMIKEGVLNGAFVGRDEFGQFPNAWDGRPVPVLHPEQNGEAISANSPRVLERTIGKLFNTHVDGDKLKTEAWLDVEKAKALGHGPMIATLEAGTQGMEVSTGYFSDSLTAQGEHNGRPYTAIHRNIRPDHLALLPGEIGACSWEDGCGVRANKSDDGVFRRAWEYVAHQMGLTTNCAGGCAGDCQCNGGHNMAEKTVAERVKALKANKVADDVIKRYEALAANKAITPKQLAMLQEMEPEQMKMAVGIVESMLDMADKPADDEPPADPPTDQGDDPNASPATNNAQSVSINSAEGRKLIANEVKEGMRRERVLDKLAANASNAFDDETLTGMATNALETYEKSIRPADYSGMGGFASNGATVDDNAQPLGPSRGGLAANKKEA